MALLNEKNVAAEAAPAELIRSLVQREIEQEKTGCPSSKRRALVESGSCNAARPKVLR